MSRGGGVVVGLVVLVVVPALALSGTLSGRITTGSVEPSGSGGGGSGISADEVLAIVTDAGSLTRADQDVYGNAFVASNRSPDGGPGTDFLIATERGGIRFGPGTAERIVATAPNELTIQAGALKTQTTYIAQAANYTNTNMRWFTDSGFWFGFFPNSTLTGCNASSEGGIRAYSTDHKPYYCNGTAAQAMVLQGGPWSGAVDFTSFSGQGCQTLTFTATGAVANEPVASGGCGSVMNGDGDLTCNVAITAANTASVRICCTDTLGCADLSPITFTATALR